MAARAIGLLLTACAASAAIAVANDRAFVPSTAASKLSAAAAAGAAGAIDRRGAPATMGDIPPFSATVAVDWANATATLATAPSLQVVSHALLMRDSPIHDKAFALLAALNASYVRYVPWLPTPKLSVAALNPPSGAALCTGEPVAEGWYGVLDCGATGGTIASIDFAAFGDVGGHCGGYARPVAGGCHAGAAGTPAGQHAAAVAARLCVGQRRCVVDASQALFGPLAGGPCKTPGGPRLAVQARCSNATKRHTYWNFTLPDQMMLDYWAAVDGQTRPQIPNFSTPPNWLYSNTTWGYNSACTGDGPDHCTYGGYEQGPAPASAHGGVAALGDYYGRLLAWYTQGGFHDEYGDWVGPGHHLNISLYEIYNEVAAEHGHTPASYTREYDAIVGGIRRFADPEKRIKFIGMNLANIRNTSTVLEWASYFLNASNHAPGARDALDYIGYHSYPTQAFGAAPDCAPIGGSADDYAQFFCYADAFLAKAHAVQALVDRLSPRTRQVFDECGTTRAGPFGIDKPAYWVSSGAQYAYIWARGARELGDRLAVVGQSQFMDSPDREPGVSMLDWRNGNGTAKYWVTRLLIESFTPGADRFAATVSNDTARLHAQAFVSGDGARRVLLINKRNAPAHVALAGVTCCTVRAVDGATNEGPPREERCGAAGTVALGAYATAVVTLC